MSVLKTVLSKLSGGLIGEITGAIDSLTISKEEKAELEIKMKEKIQNFFIQDQITDRLKIDMTSDSWMSKNIRPMTLIFILLTYTVFSVLDENIITNGHLFNINESYVELLGSWGEAIMYFYFGGRTLEKAVQLFKKK